MTPGGRLLVLVAAVADNGVIGAGGRLPWRLPADLRHFREVTTGHVVVMGRRTFESLGRPLPRRTNVVVTRRPGWAADGVLTAGSLDEALRIADAHEADGGAVMVVGGAEVYAEALPLADAQELTEVHLAPEGDVAYPAHDPTAWREVRREPGEDDGVRYDFVRLERLDAGRAG